jgi:hypothetical protein
MNINLKHISMIVTVKVAGAQHILLGTIMFIPENHIMIFIMDKAFDSSHKRHAATGCQCQST